MDGQLIINYDTCMLNDSKTEVIHLSARFTQSFPNPAITIGKAAIDPSASARNLGVVIDILDMKDHLKSLARSASFAVYKIGQILSNPSSACMLLSLQDKTAATVFSLVCLTMKSPNSSAFKILLCALSLMLNIVAI